MLAQSFSEIVFIFYNTTDANKSPITMITVVQWRDSWLSADLHVDVPLVQQLSQSVSPQLVEVFVSERKTAGLISA